MGKGRLLLSLLRQARVPREGIEVGRRLLGESIEGYPFERIRSVSGKCQKYLRGEVIAVILKFSNCLVHLHYRRSIACMLCTHTDGNAERPLARFDRSQIQNPSLSPTHDVYVTSVRWMVKSSASIQDGHPSN